MNEYNSLIKDGKVIAHHYWDSDKCWLIIFDKYLTEKDRENYRKGIQETADKNNIKVRFEDER